ncbi:MAG: methylenetetrahydrofolate reductase [Rhodospirillales bacterium]|nr:methylenetetrahydrofolate reductase [Rhodospirillales bacterium]
MTTFSFEFFPPKSDAAREAFWGEFETLAALKPTFMTMTYGAGGTTREWTQEMVIAMQDKTGIPVASHLTFIGTPKEELMAMTDMLWGNGIRHIVALRGDLPDDLSWPLDTDADYFQYTSDFVEALKVQHDFEISVGAYPEKHPDAPSLDADIKALKLKCDAGADRAITQFFFNDAAFFDFVTQCRNSGIITPIVPGLLPIGDFDRMCSFADRCGAHVPQWLTERFAGLNEQDAAKTAQDILDKQVRAMIDGGVEHIHFYTLNKANMIVKACKAGGLAV